MAAVYVDEDEAWKCPKHPPKRRKSVVGVCHVCLRERLAALCPDCHTLRPCPCSAADTSSDSSSSDAVPRAAKVLDSEPSFRRSRSVAVPSFLRSGSRYVGSGGRRVDLNVPADRTKTPSFWSNVFRSSRRSQPGEFSVQPETGTEVKKFSEIEEVEKENDEAEMRRTMMLRSRSVAVAVPMVSNNMKYAGNSKPPVKGRGWHFPSQIKAFRHTKMSKIDTERSPVYRG